MAALAVAGRRAPRVRPRIVGIAEVPDGWVTGDGRRFRTAVAAYEAVRRDAEVAGDGAPEIRWAPVTDLGRGVVRSLQFLAHAQASAKAEGE